VAYSGEISRINPHIAKLDFDYPDFQRHSNRLTPANRKTDFHQAGKSGICLLITGFPFLRRTICDAVNANMASPACQFPVLPDLQPLKPARFDRRKTRTPCRR
jgi:hypothetical protein